MNTTTNDDDCHHDLCCDCALALSECLTDLRVGAVDTTEITKLCDWCRGMARQFKRIYEINRKRREAIGRLINSADEREGFYTLILTEEEMNEFREVA